MFNLAQRVIVGCAALFGVTLGLFLLALHTLAATGQARLGYVLVVASLLIASATIYLVLDPDPQNGARCEEDCGGQPGASNRHGVAATTLARLPWN